MLTEKQVEEIREHLEKAQNPVFFFDNDEDGLCSFVLLRKYSDKGRGVPIKSFPELSVEYFKKAQELNADYIFILDKPLVSIDFLNEAHKYNLPIVWIDHHPTDAKIPEFVDYYNPLFNKEKTNEPVTALCYQISQKKEDLWISIAGCISEKFTPENYLEFKEQYPELTNESKEPWDLYYNSDIGKVARMLSFGLKDRITNVVQMLKYLNKTKSPYDVLNENSKNKTMHQRFNEIEKKYKKLVAEAKEKSKQYKNLLIYEYSGETAISSDLSNRLMYLFPERIILIMRTVGNEIKISGRGPKVREIYLDTIKDFENARGGGHEVAIGGKIELIDLEKFKEKIVKRVEQ